MTIDIIFLDSDENKINRVSLNDSLLSTAMAVGFNMMWEGSTKLNTEDLKLKINEPMVQIDSRLKSMEVATEFQHGRYLDLIDLKYICEDLINMCITYPDATIQIYK